MNNFMRYYNQNRKKIWGIIIIIAFLFIVFYQVAIGNKKENKLVDNTTININTSTLTTNQSTVTGEKVSSKKLKDEVEIIDEFLSYCNEGDSEKAYEMLTDECKQQMYKSLEIFEKGYRNPNFENGDKSCTIENWIGETYKVKITDNILATGKSNEGYAKQDYITVIQEEEESKLNINHYIGKTEINRQTENLNITMDVIENNQYMDYETYTIKITNQNEGDIKLDTMFDVKTLYLEDENGKTYSAYTNELTEPMLRIEAGHTKKVTIKFYSGYTSTKKIEAIVFSDLILYQGETQTQEQFRARV